MRIIIKGSKYDCFTELLCGNCVTVIFCPVSWFQLDHIVYSDTYKRHLSYYFCISPLTSLYEKCDLFARTSANLFSRFVSHKSFFNSMFGVTFHPEYKYHYCVAWLIRLHIALTHTGLLGQISLLLVPLRGFITRKSGYHFLRLSILTQLLITSSFLPSISLSSQPLSPPSSSWSPSPFSVSPSASLSLPSHLHFYHHHNSRYYSNQFYHVYLYQHHLYH